MKFQIIILVDDIFSVSNKYPDQQCHWTLFTRVYKYCLNNIRNTHLFEKYIIVITVFANCGSKMTYSGDIAESSIITVYAMFIQYNKNVFVSPSGAIKSYIIIMIARFFSRHMVKYRVVLFVILDRQNRVKHTILLYNMDYWRN